jgi:hypothetical protein
LNTNTPFSPRIVAVPEEDDNEVIEYLHQHCTAVRTLSMGPANALLMTQLDAKVLDILASLAESTQ